MRMPMPPARRLVAVAAAAAFAVGIAACGDSDDGDGDGSKGAAAAAVDGGERTTDRGAPPPESTPSSRDERSSARNGTANGGSAQSGAGDAGDLPPAGDVSEEEHVRDVVSGMYAAFAAGDAAGVCAVMSKAAREQLAAAPLPTDGAPSGGGSCRESFSKVLDAAASSGVLERSLKTTVGNVEIDGNVARVTISLANRSGNIRLIREDGEWRFGAPPSATGGNSP
jgi:hypothetical protein